MYEFDLDEFSLSTGRGVELYNVRLLKMNGGEDTPERRQAIIDIHIDRHKLLEEYRATDVTDKARFIELNERMVQIEYRLQDAWGFELNADYHSHWFQVPQCTCPSLDNMDRVGSPIRYISQSCPVHRA